MERNREGGPTNRNQYGVSGTDILFDRCSASGGERVGMPSRRLARLALPIVAVLLGCCGLTLYLVNHLRMQDRPELLYPYYELRLQDYGQRLAAGEVKYEETRKFGIPQYLIDHGARYCTKHGDCFCISFGFIADSAVPELWYSPSGFDPMPAELAYMNRNGVYDWIPLAPQWAACYR